MIEVSIETLGLTASAPDDEQIKEGATPEVRVQVVGGLFLPSRQGLVPIPGLAVNFRLDRDSALKLAESLKAEGERLPPPSKIEVASDLSGIDNAADALRKFKNE